MESRNTDRNDGLSLMVAMFAAGLVLMCAQVALTRLMAVGVGSHATFAILGAVMLGLAASGTRVYVHRTKGTLLSGSGALLRGALSSIGALVVFVGLTAIPAVGSLASLAILCSGVFVLPFYYVGYFITLTLEDQADRAPKLYAADLLGAATGAAATVFLLDVLSPQSAFVTLGVICAVVSLVLRRSALTAAVAVGLIALLGASVSFPDLLRLRYASSTHHSEIRWEAWDHLGHVSVLDYPENLRHVVEDEGAFELDHIESAEDRANFVALSWAMSRNYRGPIPQTRYIRIDSGVGTPIVDASVVHSGILTWDVTAAGFVVPDEIDSAGIVGTGGGRDIRTAHNFGAQRVHAFEINPKVVDAVEVGFRELSGGPYSLDGVTPHIGDARSEIAGTGPHDVIALPLTDTFSATSSGALVFSENGLYTVEAFETFLGELTDDGVLSVSRYFSGDLPGEIVRIMATAREAVKRRGGDPVAQIALIYGNSLISDQSGIGNVLVKNQPFTKDELERLRAWAAERDFDVLHPGDASVEGFSAEAILTGDTTFYEETIVETSPIWDDRPFFYDTVRMWASTVHALKTGELGLMSMAVRALLFLLVIITFAAKLFVLDPIRESEEGPDVGFGHWTTLFFGAIGFGFLAVELAVIQRCTLFLGHPTYALTVVLSSLLLFSAVGSALSARLAVEKLPTLALAVVAAVALSAVGQPPVLSALANASFAARVATVVVLVAPLGVLMGTLYPTALRQLSKDGDSGLVPWSWAVNGTAGVIATIAGMFIAMRVGYTVLFICGGIVYLGAFYAARSLRSFRTN